MELRASVGDATSGRGVPAVAVAIGSLVALALGYGRELFVAYQFGAVRETDAFFVAFFTPQVVYQLIVAGPIVWALVPILARVDATEGPLARDRLGGSMLTVVAGALTIVTLAWVAFAPQFVSAAGPYLGREGQETAAQLTRLIVPQLVAFGAGAVLTAVIYSRGRVLLPVVAQIANNAAALLLMTVLVPSFGIVGVAASLGISSALFLAILVLGVGATGGLVVPRTPRLGKHGRVLAASVLPLVAISALAQVPGVWERAVATALAAGELTSIAYGYRLLQIVQAATVAVGSIAFVRLAVTAARGTNDGGRGDLVWAARVNLRLGIFATGAVAALAPLIARGAYAGDALSAHAERVIVTTTALAALGLPFLGLIVALQQPLYVRRRWRALGAATFAGVAVHVPASSLLIPRWGPVGFVAAWLLGQGAAAAGLLVALRRSYELGPLASWRALVAAPAAWLAVVALERRLDVRSLDRLEALAAALVACLLYAAVAVAVMAATGDGTTRSGFTAAGRVIRRAGPTIVWATAVTAATLAVGVVVVVQPGLLLIPAALALVGLLLWRVEYALAALVLYLPLDWVVVLLLDSRDHPEGRLVRTALVGILAIAWLRSRRQQEERPPGLPLAVRLALAAVVTVSLLQLLNPALSDLRGAAVGIHTRLLPLALVVVGADLLRSRSVLRLASRAGALVLVAIGAVVLAQVLRGDTLIGTLGEAFAYPLPGVGAGGLPVDRYPGPFLGAGLPAALLITFVLGVATFHLSHGLWRLLWIVGALSWPLALFANNQRSLFLFLALDAPIVLLLGRYGRRLASLPLWSVLLIAPAFWLAGDAFLARASTLTDDPGRVLVSQYLVQAVEDKIVPAVTSFPLGQGLGTASPGLRFLAGAPDAQATPESFGAAVALELGIPGLLAYAALFLAVGVALLRGAITADDLATRRLCAASLALTLWVAQLAAAYEPLSYFPFAPFFWLLIGGALGRTQLGRESLVLTQPRPLRPLAAS